MEKHSVFFYMFLAFILILCLRIYYESDVFNLKCIIATKDGNKYCVRDRGEKLHKAANLLASVTQKCKQMVEYMKQNYPTDERVKRLVEGFSETKITETLPTSELTAYSQNKGEKISICLSKYKESDQLIDLNTLTFVALHELAHIMTKSIGHKQEFWENFKFLLQNAVKAKIYVPEDYKKKPRPFCGMHINDNPYYDLV